MTIRYCEKILNSYQSQADEKTYIGKEAELLIQRNDCARCLIIAITKIEVKSKDYSKYFQDILHEINLAFTIVSKSVIEYNSEKKTAFTPDLYEGLFTASLTNFINAISDLVQKTPAIITDITDQALFSNNRNAPWFYQFSFVLYEYILEREFDIAVSKIRDIFDTKKQLILKYIQNAAALYSRFEENENNSEYKDLMKALLQKMYAEEQNIQCRKPEDDSSNNTYSAYFTKTFAQTFYKASERIVGKSQLGQKIESLIKEFNERTATTAPMYN